MCLSSRTVFAVLASLVSGRSLAAWSICRQEDKSVRKIKVRQQKRCEAPRASLQRHQNCSRSNRPTSSRGLRARCPLSRLCVSSCLHHIQQQLVSRIADGAWWYNRDYNRTNLVVGVEVWARYHLELRSTLRGDDARHSIVPQVGGQVQEPRCHLP